MQQNQPNAEDYSIEQLNNLIESIKRQENLTEEQIAARLKYNEGYISQVRSRGRVSGKFIANLQREFNIGLQKAKPIAAELSGHSIDNLTESNKVLAEANRTLAEANKTLAEANHVISRNHEELIHLTKMIVSNAAPRTNLIGEPDLDEPGTEGTETLERKKKRPAR